MIRVFYYLDDRYPKNSYSAAFRAFFEQAFLTAPNRMLPVFILVQRLDRLTGPDKE